MMGVTPSFAITGELQTRNVAACLVDELSDTFDSLALRAAAGAVAWGVQLTDQAIADGNSQHSSSWWKPLEAVLMIAGIMSSAVEGASRDPAGSTIFDAGAIISIAMRYVQSGGSPGVGTSTNIAMAASPVLLSRCIWLLGRFAWALSSQQQCQNCVSGSSKSSFTAQPLPVRISACRALPQLAPKITNQSEPQSSDPTMLMAAVEGVCALLSDPMLSP